MITPNTAILTSSKAVTYTYTATSSQTLFQFSKTISGRFENVHIFKNGILKTKGMDYNYRNQSGNVFVEGTDKFISGILFSTGCTAGDIISVVIGTFGGEYIDYNELRSYFSSELVSSYGTLTTGQDIITLPWSCDMSTKNVSVFLDGKKVKWNTLTFIDSTHIRIASPVSVSTEWEAVSNMLDAMSTISGLVQQILNLQASTIEVLAGINETKFVTPKTLSEWKAYNHPNSNYVVDGAFDFWYEADSQNTSGYGSDTMWANIHDGASTKIHSKQSFLVGESFPDGISCPSFFSRTIVTTGNTSASRTIKTQRIEDITKFSNKEVTLSFYAKADSTKNISIEFVQGFGSGGSSTVTSIGVTKLSLSSAWKKYKVTTTLPSISSKVIGSDNSFSVVFWLDAGSSFSARTNTLGSQSGTFDLALVKLEDGNIATGYSRDKQQEELRVNRFAYLMGSKFATNPFERFSSFGLYGSSTGGYLDILFPVAFRKLPVLTTGPLSNFLITNTVFNTVPTSITVGTTFSSQNRSLELFFSISSGGVAGNAISLCSNNTSIAWLFFDARL